MRHTALALALIVAPAVAGAQNLIQNGDFTAGVNHWSYHTQRMDWVSDDGAAADGCMELGDADNNGGAIGAWQEVAVSPSTTYRLRIWFRLPPGSAAVNGVAWVRWRNGSGFLIGDSQVLFGTPVGSDWVELSGDVVSLSGAASGDVVIAVLQPGSGSDESVVRFDDVFFGLPGSGPTVFGDGFESGDTAAWSVAVP